MCRIASLFLLQKLKVRMSVDKHDFNNIGARAVKFFFLARKEVEGNLAILTET
jgi:hypothetical protein